MASWQPKRDRPSSRAIGPRTWDHGGAAHRRVFDPGDTADAVAGDARATGVVASIDTGPWTYDGNAVVQVETAGGRRLQVQLPARWNLCQAAPVDIEALAVGMRVDVVGAVAGEEDVVVVCADASHRLAPVDAG